MARIALPTCGEGIHSRWISKRDVVECQQEAAMESISLTTFPAQGGVAPLPILSVDAPGAEEPEYFVLVADLNNALGYGPDGLRQSMRKWLQSGALIEDQHVQTWTDQPLESLKALGKARPRAPSAQVLTEEGMYIVLMMTEKPEANKIRHQWAKGIRTLRAARAASLRDPGIMKALEQLSQRMDRLRPQTKARVVEAMAAKAVAAIPQPVVLDYDGALEQWRELFGTQRVAAADAFATARAAGGPLGTFATHNTVVFGHRLGALVQAKKLSRGSTGSARFYQLQG